MAQLGQSWLRCVGFCDCLRSSSMHLNWVVRWEKLAINGWQRFMTFASSLKPVHPKWYSRIKDQKERRIINGRHLVICILFFSPFTSLFGILSWVKRYRCSRWWFHEAVYTVNSCILLVSEKFPTQWCLYFLSYDCASGIPSFSVFSFNEVGHHILACLFFLFSTTSDVSLNGLEKIFIKNIYEQIEYLVLSHFTIIYTALVLRLCESRQTSISSLSTLMLTLIDLYESKYAELLFQFISFTGGWVLSIAFSRDGNKLAWTKHNSFIFLADVSGLSSGTSPTVSCIQSEFLPFTSCIWVGASTFIAAGYDCSPMAFRCKENKIEFVHTVRLVWLTALPIFSIRTFIITEVD